MVIKLGINGFGRIGRVIFRAGFNKKDLEIAAINDPAIDIEYICYLIKFDSTHGKFNGCITHTKDEIYIDDNKIKVFHDKLPSSVPWQTAGVEYVIEASGMFTSLEKASGHLAGEGVKRVIVTAPSVDVPMVILGVNQEKLNAGQKVISCASSTLYCLAPIVKVLEDSFGVAEGFITSIHAMTPSLKPLDGLCLRGKHWRDHRSIHQNIIPATTGACRALGRIIPRVKDRLTGLAFRVPIVNVSVLDLTIRLSSNTSINDIVKAVEKASNTAMQNIIKISKDEAVSSDFIGESHSCILDADSSLQLKPNFYKLVCWYENEYSYACRVLDSIFFLEKQSQLNLLKTINVKQNFQKQDVVQQTDSCKKEVLCSALHDIGFKSMLRKPISSHNSSTTKSLSNKDTKKRSDIIKVWNDEKDSPKPLARQNRSSFFHSCVAIGPQNEEEIECRKAHERLEMLKKEFTKMVNITESLLKKSYITLKPEIQSITKNETSKSVNIITDINVEKIQHSCETFTEIYDNVQKGSNFSDMSGDYRLSDTSRNINIANKAKDNSPSERSNPKFKMNMPSKNNFECTNKLVIFENETKNKLPFNDVNKLNIPVDLRSAYTPSPRVLPDKIIRIQDDREIPDEKARHTNLETINKSLPQNMDIQCCVVEKNKNSQVSKDHIRPVMKHNNVSEAPLEQTTRIGTRDSGFFSLFKKNSAAEICRNNKLTKHSMDIANDKINIAANKLLESICSENTAETFKKDAHTINDMNTNIDNGSLREEIVKIDDENQSNQSISHTVNNDDTLSRSFVNVGRFSSPEQMFMGSDHTSKYGSPDNTSITASNIEVRRHKQDIYDKLDSVSETDSNNSFQIHEKKSQIIRIADLTSSLEDLARLDKICKIIEISDELSNKLFSALDNTEGIDVKKKNWSFKDLCERLKLDDFCDKIFGKPSG